MDKRRQPHWCCPSVIACSFALAWSRGIKICPHVVRFYKQTITGPAGSKVPVSVCVCMQNTESRQRHGTSEQRREIKKRKPVFVLVSCSSLWLNSMTRTVVKSTLRWWRRRRHRRRIEGTAFHTIRQRPKRVEDRVRQMWEKEIEGKKRVNKAPKTDMRL